MTILDDAPVLIDLSGNLVSGRNEKGPLVARELLHDIAWSCDDVHSLASLLPAWVAEVVTPPDKAATYCIYSPVQQMDLAGLRKLLLAERIFGTWRAARMALDLCDSLIALHDAGLPQMFLHPRRIGRWKSPARDSGALNRTVPKQEFAFLPSAYRLLPPLSQLCGQIPGDWYFHIAPEVYRLRARDEGRGGAAERADVYSLGRILLSLIRTDIPETPAAGLDFIKRLVELRETDSVPIEVPEALQPLAAFAVKLSAFFPEDRPTLSVARGELNALLEQADPRTLIRRYRECGCHAEIAELERAVLMEPVGVAPAYPKVSKHRFRAELAMAQTPPNTDAAFGELAQARALEPRNLDISRQLVATGLDVFRTCPENIAPLVLSATIAREIHRASHADDDFGVWLGVLNEMSALRPDGVLEHIASITRALRGPEVVTLQAHCMVLHLKNELDAWELLAEWMREFGLEERVYDYAVGLMDAADPEHLSAETLTGWMAHCRQRNLTGYDAGFALAWRLNGHAANERECKSRAKKWTPPVSLKR